MNHTDDEMEIVLIAYKKMVALREGEKADIRPLWAVGV